MKKKLIIAGTILLSLIFIIIIVDSAIKMNKPNEESDIEGKDISKEEYMYKEELLDLGYSVDEIDIIEKNISTIDVKNYLLTKKYDNLSLFATSPYFEAVNIERYESYYKKKADYSTDEIVLYVQIGLDNDFYTNIEEITNYTDVDTLVNKYHQLPKDATFNDLVVLPKGYASGTSSKVRTVMYDALIKMMDDAKEDGANLLVISAFRTWSNQTSLFNNNKKKNGEAHALMYSAKPGHSEHELGLAIDFNKATIKFEGTKEDLWLRQNAYKYGFIMRYPKGKEYITGFAYEPWHYRYLGVNVATKIYEENITYEEYLVKYKK